MQIDSSLDEDHVNVYKGGPDLTAAQNMSTHLAAQSAACMLCAARMHGMTSHLDAGFCSVTISVSVLIAPGALTPSGLLSV